MSCATSQQFPEIDDDARFNCRLLAAARVLFALVETMKDDLGDAATNFYESHLALGTGKALMELAEGQTVPSDFTRLDAALPGMVQDFFLRAERVMEGAAEAARS